jgi:small-conductance mechanosensitive channel
MASFDSREALLSAVIHQAIVAFRKFMAATSGPWHRHAIVAGGLRALAGMACVFSLCNAVAQSLDPDRALDDARQQIEAIQKAVKEQPVNLDDDDLGKLRSSGLAAQAEASTVETMLSPQVASTTARIAELGTPAPGAKEDPDVVAQRAALTRTFQNLDGQVKLARLLQVEAEQAITQLATLRRSQFQARLGERTNSLLSAAFWADLADDLPQDSQRARAVLSGYGLALQSTSTVTRAMACLSTVALLAALWLVHRLSLAWLKKGAPDGRARRSLYALLRVAVLTGAFGAVAAGLYLLLGRQHLLADDAQKLLDSVVGMIVFGGFQFGLLEAFLSVKRPSWRLMAMPDEVAAAMRWFPLQLTLVSFPSWFADRLASTIDASLSTTVAINCFVALAIGLSVAFAFIRGGHALRRVMTDDGSRVLSVWQLIAMALDRLVLLIAIVSLLSGYVAFGSFAIRQLVWVGLVLGAAYLLSAVIDDLLMAWLKRHSATTGADTPAKAGAPSGSLYAQVAVLASGAVRVGLWLFALTLLLAPSGESPAELWQSSIQWQRGLSLGEFQLNPGATFRALAVLVAGFAIVRGLRAWLASRYLPSTSLDLGMRASTTTLFGYAGSVAVVAMALSTLGIGLERIAWVASALSVGIGFGLQAVVQNFVSGLILLAERPVKVGDWVSLGGIEGDVRRINVRATEIQMSDHSTVIVPNSEFITKVVRNVTLADPLGLVQVKLPVPVGTDPVQVRDILLAAFVAEPDILDAPEPAVLLDSVDDGQLMFIATGYVHTPRIAGRVRSAVLFAMLARLDAAGLKLSRAPTMLLKVAPSETKGDEAGVLES